MMLFKRIAFSLLLILFVAGNVFGQGFSNYDNDASGPIGLPDPCLTPGEAVLQVYEPIALEINIQLPLFLGYASGGIVTPNIRPMFVNAYANGSLIYTSPQVTTFQLTGVGCNSNIGFGLDIFGLSMGTYTAAVDLDFDLILESVEYQCLEGYNYLYDSESITIVIETLSQNGGYTGYAPSIFGLCGSTPPVTEFELPYVICCGSGEDDPISSGDVSSSRANEIDEVMNSCASPNPFTNELTLNPNNENTEIIIRDTSGKVIYLGKGSNRISTSSWDAGIYIIYYFEGIISNTERILKL